MMEEVDSDSSFARACCDFEHVLGIEQPGVNLLRRQIRLTYHKYLRTFIAGGLWLCGLNLLEELLKDPEKRIVVLAAEHFRDKPSTRNQELAGKLQRISRKKPADRALGHESAP